MKLDAMLIGYPEIYSIIQPRWRMIRKKDIFFSNFSTGWEVSTKIPEEVAVNIN
jgi:hypothetical protein